MDKHFKKFMETGKIEHYLKYKESIREKENEKDNGNSSKKH